MNDETIEIVEMNLEDEPSVYKVQIRGEETTEHTITLDGEYWTELTNQNEGPDGLVRAALEFLLKREPNTSILPEFNLKQIQDYFPEFEDEMREQYDDLAL